MQIAFSLLSLSLASTVWIASAAAQNLAQPKVERATVAWQEALASLTPIPDTALSRGMRENKRYRDMLTASANAAMTEPLALLNSITSEQFNNVDVSPVPVMLPVNIAAIISDRVGSQSNQQKARRYYVYGDGQVNFFWPGPSGYDAVVTTRVENIAGLALPQVKKEIAVHISGSILNYVLGPSTSPIDSSFENDDARFTDTYIREQEAVVRLTARAWNVSYLLSLECGAKAIACDDAKRVLIHTLSALRIVGGRPTTKPTETLSNDRNRPPAESKAFTYHPAGSLIPGTGYNGHPGKSDNTVYAYIRYPVKNGPSFLNSQVFMHGGNCLENEAGQPEMVPPYPGANRPYHCRVNNINLVFNEGTPANYSYPWRDDFCESRGSAVQQCPGGRGHQGQDIRASNCVPEVKQRWRCAPYHHELVAVRDAVVVRGRANEALYLVVNTPTEHFRARYLHMHPAKMNADGMLHGKKVKEGERIGLMGTYMGGEGGTYYHLHFDIQVPSTTGGWQFVSPYMSLVTAYERLIGARGRPIVTAQ